MAARDEKWHGGTPTMKQLLLPLLAGKFGRHARGGKGACVCVCVFLRGFLHLSCSRVSVRVCVFGVLPLSSPH